MARLTSTIASWRKATFSKDLTTLPPEKESRFHSMNASLTRLRLPRFWTAPGMVADRTLCTTAPSIQSLWAKLLQQATVSQQLGIEKLDLDDHSFHAIFQGVAANKSPEDFDARGMYIDNNRLLEFCESFHAHPTIKWLFFDLNRGPHGFSNPQMPIEQVERRMQIVLSMLHVNSVLGLVTLADDRTGGRPLPQNLLDEIETRLVMNWTAFEAQCHSLGPVAPGLRPKLLGRALHMARLHPALQWKFLSEHLDVVVETADERIFSKLDEASQKKRKQADRQDAQKRAKRVAS